MIFGSGANSNEYVTEIWYFNDPQPSGGDITASWLVGSARDIAIGVKSFNFVDDQNPVLATACASDGGMWGTDPIGKNPEVSIISSAQNTVFGTATTYTGNANALSADGGVLQLWRRLRGQAVVTPGRVARKRYFITTAAAAAAAACSDG